METVIEVATIEDCDQVTSEVVENTRRALGMSSLEFSETLGWSQRKYQRTLDAASEDGLVPRDVALAVRGILSILSSDGLQEPTELQSPGAPSSPVGDEVPEIFQELADSPGSWTERIAPHIMRVLSDRASRGALITYGELAETLEDAGLTKRVWPRTAYAHPLGLVCSVCIELGKIRDQRIPLLTAIVVRSAGEPGVGFDGMVRHFLKKQEKGAYQDAWKRFKANRTAEIAVLQQEVFDFPYWSEVLKAAQVR